MIRTKNISRIFSILFIFLVVDTTVLSNQLIIQPSFNCTKAISKSEKLICSRNDLAMYDLLLNDLYTLALVKYKPDDIRVKQRKWIREKRKLDCSINSTKLLSCYINRVKELYNIYDYDEEKLITKYKNILIRIYPDKSPLKIPEPEKRFVANYNLRQEIIRMFGSCSDVSAYISSWYQKHLIINIHTSDVGCTGRSVHYFYKETYCYVKGNFVKTSPFFDCPISSSTKERIKISEDYFSSNLNSFIRNPSNKKKLLGNLLYEIWQTKNSYLKDEFFYSPTVMNYIVKNATKLIVLIPDVKYLVVEIIGDLILVHNSIIKTSGWEINFNDYKPYKPRRYNDLEYIPISDMFPTVGNISNKQITKYIFYSFNELYHRFWYKSYKQDSMRETLSALLAVKKAIKNDK